MDIWTYTQDNSFTISYFNVKALKKKLKVRVKYCYLLYQFLWNTVSVKWQLSFSERVAKFRELRLTIDGLRHWQGHFMHNENNKQSIRNNVPLVINLFYLVHETMSVCAWSTTNGLARASKWLNAMIKRRKGTLRKRCSGLQDYLLICM